MRRNELAEARRKSGLSQEALAQVVGVSSASVANWEQGATTPYVRHRSSLANALGVSMSELERILLGAGGDVPRWLTMYTQMEQMARSVNVLGAAIIPALAQTREYATWIDTEYLGQEATTPAQTEARVEHRMRRKQVLLRSPDPLVLRVYVGMHLLHPAPGYETVMAGQVDHLLEISEWPNVDIRLVPSHLLALVSAGALALVDNGVGNLVVEEGFDVDHYHETESAVEKAQRLFGGLDQRAYSSLDTQQRLRAAREEISEQFALA